MNQIPDMKTHDFYYDLPEELIAQTPAEPRDSSRLMVLDRKTGAVSHHHFYDIVDYLMPGDCLIVNDSRVLPARLYGEKETGAKVEFLLLTQREKDVWEVLCGPGRKAKPGAKFSFGGGLLHAEILDIIEGGNRIARFTYEGNFYSILDQIGQMPLPHYIAAAPTAGLHFTPELLEKVKAKGVKVGAVTLHVGLGTFRPVSVEKISEHKMHSEHYHLSAETAALIQETKKNGGRVIAVGTTSCRTLESVAMKEGKICESDGWTDIFIYPGYEFKVLDGLITNFHLPESTLVMLVSALAGREHILNAYKIAVQEKYRFFSFGDAMFIR